uniref:Uncharacterized protein n=1 Tax=Chrysotila carterae TaxID=13221 RepID=A0A6T0ED94_CHRCT|mmetsp:Transcript_14313/g.30228  ORF Transcript_14313/g.30228 Transcript_14313/m.30228 type:complete len:149 (-) Transcript_14313:681-1127(-)
MMADEHLLRERMEEMFVGISAAVEEASFAAQQIMHLCVESDGTLTPEITTALRKKDVAVRKLVRRVNEVLRLHRQVNSSNPSLSARREIKQLRDTTRLIRKMRPFALLAKRRQASRSTTSASSMPSEGGREQTIQESTTSTGASSSEA